MGFISIDAEHNDKRNRLLHRIKEEINDLRKNWGGGPLISRPDLWPVNVEIDFGDGLYGKRCSGTITRAANAENFVLITYHNCGTVFASGGMYATIDNNYYIHIGQSFVNGEIGTIYRDQAKDLYFMSRIPFNRTNAPYDIWALYTKA